MFAVSSSGGVVVAFVIFQLEIQNNNRNKNSRPTKIMSKNKMKLIFFHNPLDTNATHVIFSKIFIYSNENLDTLIPRIIQTFSIKPSRFLMNERKLGAK